MRILIIAPNISRPYLGPAAVVHNTLKGFIKINKELEREDIEITFLSINDKIKSKKLTDNINIIRTKRFPPVTFTGEIQALFASRKLEKPDLVHSHDLYEIFPWILKKIPTIFTLHGIVWKEKMFTKSLYAKLWYYLYEKRLRAYHKKFTKFVAISPYVLEELKTKGLNTSKAVVIENPVSEEFFNVEKREEPVILYPATLIPRKLVTLLSDKHLRSKMGREGKKVAEERWKDEVIARKLLEMYFSAIEQDKNTKR